MRLERQDQAGILYIDTDRNNAINDEFIREAHQLMDEAERDPAIRALVVTSTHKTIFCPGVDLPSLMGRSALEIRRFYEALTGIVRRKVAYPKPEVYALNGHSIAGGCMMALAGDYRLMAEGRFSFGLMEIDVGLAAPIGIVEMIRHLVGGRVAERVLFSGERFTPDRALALGLVDEVVEPERLMDRALEEARLLGGKPAGGYQRSGRPVAPRDAFVQTSRPLQGYTSGDVRRQRLLLRLTPRRSGVEPARLWVIEQRRAQG